MKAGPSLLYGKMGIEGLTGSDIWCLYQKFHGNVPADHHRCAFRAQ